VADALGDRLWGVLRRYVETSSDRSLFDELGDVNPTASTSGSSGNVRYYACDAAATSGLRIVFRLVRFHEAKIPRVREKGVPVARTIRGASARR